ncbi:PTS sugar transporter subunit IIA, partial [Streptococcus pneumoniae]|uniref:PTS sugar transporter subunit IIA n=1 Tax=Streptococcus pneumoniae TaxID=1313 RepID=UPI001CE1EB27
TAAAKQAEVAEEKEEVAPAALAEVLIHVGIDTVSMNGDGFEAKVAQGNKVKAGDVLGTFDSNKIAAAGLDDTTMVIVTNTA